MSAYPPSTAILNSETMVPFRSTNQETTNWNVRRTEWILRAGRRCSLLFLCTTLIAGVALTSCGGKKKDSGSGDSAAPTPTADAELQALNDQIKADPENFQHYYDRAKYYGQHENYKEALEDLERAQLADSTQGKIYLYRGEIYYFKQNIEGAYSQYENCLRVDADNTDCLLKKAEIDLALNNYEKSLEHINSALKVDEQLPYAYYLKGRLYRDPGVADTTLSASSYQTAIELNPDFYEAYFELGGLYAARKSDLALEYFNTALHLKPESVEAWYAKGLYLQETAFRSKDRFKLAFACYDKVDELQPIDARAPFNKGYIYLEYLGQFDSASFYFSEAIQRFPTYYQAYYNRGLCYESLSRAKDAERDYRKALSINPQYTDAARALERVVE